MHFDFVGKFFEEKEKQFFFGYIKEHGLEDYATYHGVVDGEQSISILEAMGNEQLVATTDHAGISDIVEDGVTGIIANGKEMGTLMDLMHSSSISGIRRNAYLHVRKMFTNVCRERPESVPGGHSEVAYYTVVARKRVAA